MASKKLYQIIKNDMKGIIKILIVKDFNLVGRNLIYPSKVNLSLQDIK